MPSVELKEPAAAKTTTDAQDGRTVTAVAQEEPADAKSVTIAQLIGAVLFAVGSAFFVWMAWADDWVLPWRVGCALWIVGCVPYLWPPLRQELQGSCTAVDHLSNALQVAAMLSWVVGSAFAFHDDEDTGMAVNCGGYLAGSACLLLDALLQARALRSETIARREQLSLLADLLAGIFYVLAGGFAGYASETPLLRFGNCCWLVASLFSCSRPFLALFAAARPQAPPARCDNTLEKVL